MSGSPTVLALVCPSCGAALTGLSTDALFGCTACATGYGTSPENPMRPFPVRQVLAAAEAGVPLPFWRLAVSVTPPVDGAPRVEHVFVPAFDMRRRSYFGDPGLEWTIAGLDPEAAPSERPLLGASLSFEEAAELAPYYVYRAIDEKVDVTGMELDVEVTEASIVLVLFPEDGKALVDPLGGGRYPQVAFCDLPSLRALDRDGSGKEASR